MNRGQGNRQMQKTLHAEHTSTPLIAKRRLGWWAVVARTVYMVLTGTAVFLFVFSFPTYYAHLTQLREQLVNVVQATMQPTHVSLWLREPESKLPRLDRMPPRQLSQ